MPKKIELRAYEYIELPDSIDEQLKQIYEYEDDEGFWIETELRKRIEWLVESYENKLKENKNV